jgi:hypothetical protein
VPEIRQGCYLEHGQLVGETEEMGRAANIITAMGPLAGLIMSTALTTPRGTRSKSMVHIPPSAPWTRWPLGRGIEA